MATKVFVNRTLNLRKIRYIGLDMDHTLVMYNVPAFEALAYKTMIDKLVEKKNYPESIRNLQFDMNLTVRGLVIDRRKGNLLKVSRHGAIRASNHGTQQIDFRQQQKIYKGTYIDLGDPDYLSIDTDFSRSFATLFGQLVDVKDHNDELPDYPTLADNLLEALDDGHRDGSLKEVVKSDLPTYILKDEATALGLERFKKHGKKLFILTNSEFSYTKALLDYAINPFLKEHQSWQDIFEFVITSAQKPRFFYDDLRFFKVNPESSNLSVVEDKIKSGIYYGGSAARFTQDLNLERDDILYVGDHIYGDIVRLKKDCNWRTAMVIEGLDHEIAQSQKSAPYQEEIRRLMDKKQPLEDQLVEITSEQIESGKKKDDSTLKNLLNEISEIDQKIGSVIKKQQELFNYHWGEIMRAGNEESYFAQQVDRYACIYMTKISDLLSLSPRTYFRARRRPLAHEL